MTSLLTPGVHLKQPDSTYINFGIGVIQQADGKAKLQAVYAKWWKLGSNITALIRYLSRLSSL